MNKQVCAKIQELNTPLVTEGLQYMQKAIDVRPNYDDAMSYMNLLNRRKADLECGNDNARKADVQASTRALERAQADRTAGHIGPSTIMPATPRSPS